MEGGFLIVCSVGLTAQGRNAKGEEGLFPATYITEDPDYVVPTPPAAAAAGLPADGTDPKSTPSPDTAATDQAGKSPIPVPASPNNNQTSTPPLATSDKLAASGNLASPFSAAAGDNRNSLLDVTGAPRGASGTAGAVGAGAAVGAGVGAAGVAGSNNVMGSTIGQVQDAIDTMGKGSPAMDSNGPTVPQGVQLRDPQEASKANSGVIRRGIDDDEDDDDEADPEAVGIAHDARARLAEQAKLANEERDRQAQRESGGIADLIYSDESEDEDDASSHRNSNTYPRTHRNGSVTTPTIDEESDLHATREEGTFAKQQNLPTKQEDEFSSAATPVSTTNLATAPVLSTSVAETQVNGGPEAKTPTAVVDDNNDEATPQQRSASPATESNKGGVLAGAAAAIGAGTAAIGAALLSSSDSQTTIHAKDAPQADKDAVQSDLQKTQTPEITHSHSPSLKQSETLPQSQSPSIQQTSSDLQPSPKPQQSERLAEDTKQASPRPDAAQLQPALPIAAAAAASSQTPPVQQTPPPQHSSTMSTPAGLPSAATPSSTVNLASPPPPTPDSSRIPAKPPATWTVEDVVQWSRARGFDEAVSAKFVEHDISGDVLLELDANLLKELDIPQLGKRLRIASAINDLRRPVSNPSSSHSQQQQHHAYPTPTSIQQSPAYADQHLPTSSAGSAHSGSMPPSAFVGGAALAAAAGAGAAGIAASHTTTPGGSPIVDDHHSAWAHGRKVSVTPTTSSIDEAKAIDTKPKVFGTPANNNTSSSASSTANGTINGHTATRSVSSVPTTPGTPAIGGIGKRESTGSLGHKKKGSVDKSDRLSFFGRGRKPPPVGSPGSSEQRSSSSRLGFGSGSKPAMNTMHADRPEKRVSSGPSAAVGGALRTIGTPDKQGYLKKRGGGYNAWKTRFFVLKGSHLYFLKSESEDHVKGRIDLKGHRIIVDESSNGSYGFRLVGPGVEKPHFFSSSDQREIRDWMKALMKATIQRDYTVPVTSSCNIPTIPLSEAQALQPRPPSPGERDATQRANRRENVNQLTPRDASVLMSLDTSGSGRRMTSHGSTLTVQPSRPSRDTRRPSGDMRRPSTSTRPSVQSYYQTEPTPEQTELLNWVNQVLPSQYPRVANFPNSFISGEVIFLLVKHISGLELDPPVPSSAFAPDSKGMPNDEGLLAMGQMVIEAGVDNGSRLHLPDVRAGDAARITELLEIVRAWAKERV